MLMLNRDRHDIPPVLSPRIDRLRLIRTVSPSTQHPRGLWTWSAIGVVPPYTI